MFLSEPVCNRDIASSEWSNEMRLVNCIAFILLPLSANCVAAGNQAPAPLVALQEAFQAAMDNLVSGSGTGSYDIYAAPSGKGAREELKVKAKAKVFFDHGKFHVRLDYEKDNIHRLQSRVVIYDGTAILVSLISKRIHPAGSEGEIYEANPDPMYNVLRKTGFDYNPCQLPLSILHVDWLSDPEYASNLTISQDETKDYSGSYVFTGAPRHLRGVFSASQQSGFNIDKYQLLIIDSNNRPFITSHATWERKKNIWYVKSIDTQWSFEDGSAERTVFRYSAFEPNVEVDSSLFKFDALSLSPKARVLDRRPNAEQPVLHQPPSSKVDAAKLDKLADAVKTLAPKPPKHRVSMISPPRSNKWRRYYLLGAGAFFALLGLLLMWKRIRARKANNP